MRWFLIFVVAALLLGIDSCTEDYEFCPKCRLTPTPTPTTTPSVTATPTPKPTPKVSPSPDMEEE